MKKNLICRLCAWVLLIGFMVSCTKKSSEYVHLIPMDATVVVGIHTQSLIEKSGTSEEDKQKLLAAIKGEMRAESFEQVEKIIQNGAASGLSLKDPIYYFSSGQHFSAVVMKINDIGKFTKALKAIHPEFSDGEIRQADGYRTFEINNALCAFNESALLIVSSNENDRIVSLLMKHGDEKSITQHAYFNKMSAQKGDVVFFYTPSDIAIIGTVNFERGRIALHAEATSDKKEGIEFLHELRELSQKPNHTFIANFPVSTLAHLTLRVNGEKLYSILQENPSLRERIPSEKAELFKKIISMLDGDITVGLTNISISDMGSFVAYAEAKDGSALSMLYDSKREMNLGYFEDIIKLSDNQYVFKSRQMNIFYGFKDNFLYATNDEMIYKNMGQKESKSIKDAIYAPNMKGKYEYAVINFKAIMDLPVVKMLSAIGGEAAAYVNIANKVSYIEAFGEDDNQANVNVWLVDEDTNALKQLLDLAKQFAGF